MVRVLALPSGGSRLELVGSDRLSVVLVRVEPHKGYVTERVRSSAA